MVNDMHDGTIQQGDTWLKYKFDKFVQWALKNNSMLVVYFDEDNKLTDNRIPVVIVGQHVMSNNQVATKYDHYNWTRTILNWMGASTWNTTLANRVAVTGFYK